MPETYHTLFLIIVDINILFLYHNLFGFNFKKNIISWVEGILMFFIAQIITCALLGSSYTHTFVFIAPLINLIFVACKIDLNLFLLYPVIVILESTLSLGITFMLALLNGIPEGDVSNDSIGKIICEVITLLLLMILLKIFNHETDSCCKKISLDRTQIFIAYLASIFARLMIYGVKVILNNRATNLIGNLIGMTFSFTIILVLFMTLYIVFSKAEITTLESREKVYKECLNYQREQINQIIHEQEEIRKMRHDIKGHLNVLSSYLNNPSDAEKAKTYLEHMLSDNRFLMTSQITGNPTIDALLTKFLDDTAKNKINFNISGVIPWHNDEMDYDIVSILYNLLSNSFEACENLKSNDKWISLKIGIINEFLIINVKNSSENNIVVAGTILQTSKKNKFEHGLGSRSVYEIVNKYHGQVQYESSDGIFTADVIMSCKL